LRYLIGGGALLLAVVVAAFFLIPRLIDDERIERRLAEAVTAMTGQDLGVAGGIDVKLLPQPLLTVHRPTLGSVDDGFILTADRLDLDVDLWSLLVGALRVNEASLVRPELRLAADPGRLYAAVADRLVTSGTVLPWQRLRIIRGTVAALENGPLLQAVDAMVERTGEAGPSSFSLVGQLADGSGRVQADGQLGGVAAGRPAAAQLHLEVSRDGVPSRLEFRGVARLTAGNRGLDGRVSLDLPSPPVLGDMWGPVAAAGDHPWLPSGPVTLDAEMVLDLAAETPSLRLDGGALVVDGQPMTGTLALAMGAAPEMALSLAADRLVLPEPGLPASDLPVDVLRALPDGLSGTATFRADALEWRDVQLRQAALDLALQGDGRLAITRATALLPGPGNLAFTGELALLAEDGPPQLRGRLELSAQEPAVLVAAFMEPPEPVRRSTTLAVDTELIWEPSGLTLRDIDVSLDTLGAAGDLAWRPAADDRLAQLAVRGRIDRLAFEEVLDRDAPMATVDRLLDRLALTDFALDLRIERTSFRETRLGALVLALDSGDGRVTIDRASLTDVGGSAATVTGEIDAAARAFDLALAVDIASLPRLLRLFEEAPDPMLALLGPMNLRARLTGDLEEAALQATLEADAFSAEGSGRLEAWRTAPSGSLTVTVDAGEAAALVRQLAAIPVTEPLLQAPLSAGITIDLDRGALATAGLEVALGDLTLELDAGRASAEGGPLDRFALRLGPLGPAGAEALYRLATPLLDLVPGPPAAWLGYWPAQELSWDWLWARDAELAVALLPADTALPPVEIIGQLRDGVLTIPAFRFASEDVLVEGGLAVAGRRDADRVDWALDLAGEGIAAPAVLEALGANPRAMTGALDLEARLLSSGRSLRAMVANLEGTVNFVVTDGLLGAAVPDESGIPLRRLEGSLDIDRGVVRPSADGVAFRGPDGTGRIDGYVDLLAWIAELDLTLDGYGGDPLVRQRLFGPIGQVMPMAPPPMQAPDLSAGQDEAPAADQDGSMAPSE
jgi:hypothetical protein